jgi:diguanylate cyclase (GGDEF)-like protein
LAGFVGLALVAVVFDVGGTQADEFVRVWVACGAYVVAAGVVALRAFFVDEYRSGWVLLAVGLILYATGSVLWALWLEDEPSVPVPSLADAFWLSFYPVCFAGLVSLGRRAKGATVGAWLEGTVAALGAAALVAAVVVRPVLDAATGSDTAVATTLAYPVGDLLLVGLVTGILGLRGWKLDPRWIALGAGFLMLCAADTQYLLHVADGSRDVALTPTLFYISGVALIARAAWQPRVPAPLDGWPVLVVPGGFALAAVGLLVHSRFDPLDSITFTLAILTILVALARTVLSFRDLRALAQIRREASTDDLTELSNRRHFLRTVDGRISAAGTDGETLALLILDLDKFKELNDVLGHAAGDELLRQLGPRLQETVRATDTLARLGGDEFGLLIGPPAGRHAAERAAARIRAALNDPFEIQGLRMSMSASIGIALFPDDAQDGERLLQHADAAMYRAKTAGSGWEVYSGDDSEDCREARELASELPGAIAADQLELRFQPIGAIDGRIVGMEALVRWAHPERGLLTPDQFIPIAEQSGHMRELTRWVLHSSLARARNWRRRGHDLRLSVNVSVPDLLDVEFPAEVAGALTAHGVPPRDLVLEVTETSLMSDRVRICEVLERLAAIGVGLSLDDFGTGYSSLLHLKTLPVTELKIDRGFVGGMVNDRSDREIVSATIQLAHNLGLRAVAEGVEDEAALWLLSDLGCELIQGYHLAQPLSSREADAFLSSRAALTRELLERSPAG